MTRKNDILWLVVFISLTGLMSGIVVQNSTLSRQAPTALAQTTAEDQAANNTQSNQPLEEKFKAHGIKPREAKYWKIFTE